MTTTVKTTPLNPPQPKFPGIYRLKTDADIMYLVSSDPKVAISVGDDPGLLAMPDGDWSLFDYVDEPLTITFTP